MPAAFVRAVTTLVCLAFASGASASDQVVVVRVYNSYGVSDHASRTASRTVHRLFQDAGLDTKWRHCRVVGRRAPLETDACSDSLRPNELIVRIVAGPQSASQDATMTLGDAFIDPATKAGALATVYADRVEATAGALHVDLGTMVGRAIAHELGHLLLGTQTHTAAGLMRALWRSTTVLRSEEADWLFTPEQRTVMRLAVATRLTAPR